jgi:hypothetical protein
MRVMVIDPSLFVYFLRSIYFAHNEDTFIFNDLENRHGDGRMIIESLGEEMQYENVYCIES